MKNQLSTLAAAIGIALAPAAFAQQTPGTTPSDAQATQPSSGGGTPSGMQQDSQTVRQVQQQLKDKGHDIAVDGQMGPQTQAALREYQQKEGLDASGNLDARTLAALGVQADASSGSSTSPSSADTPSTSPSMPPSGAPSTSPPSGSTPSSSGGMAPQGSGSSGSTTR